MIDNAQQRREVSIIVPARNEEACLQACLQSLRAQADVLCEIFVVDDGSSDNTRPIAKSFADVTVLAADPLPAGWSGKSNACLTAAKRATGNWLLFTDADTIHAPKALASALREAQTFCVSMLSYSPKQETVTFLEKAVLPVIFSELTARYRTEAINDQASDMAAANGQYILIKREDYWAIGGHAAVATEIVEDVALAKLLKHSGRGLRFRYEGELVRTRMYRSSSQLIEGWTKNLYQLFPSAIRLGFLRLLEFITIVAGIAFSAKSALGGSPLLAVTLGLATLLLYFNFLRRIRRAYFDAVPTALSFFGLPFFSLLLWRSVIKHRVVRLVTWKGRRYRLPSDIPRSPTNDKHSAPGTMSAKA